MDKCCQNCYYCAELKNYKRKSDLLSTQIEIELGTEEDSLCCILFLEKEKKIIETVASDICECWKEG